MANDRFKFSAAIDCSRQTVYCSSMTANQMHDDEVHTDVSLVRRLIAAQFPRWSGLPVTPLRSAGTDNALYRLGDELLVRLPRIESATNQVHKEHQWLPRLAPYLPLAVPVPLAKGEPGDGYPWSWSIYRWLEGENTAVEDLADPQQAALDLAHFIIALQGIDTAGGPPPGPENTSRGVPLAERDGATRAAIDALEGMVNSGAAMRAWEAALQTPEWPGPPLWIHGDLLPGNLLARQERLSAVIDFGCLTVGDPACDVMAAWTYLTAETRQTFRTALGVDDDTWARGRGWALSFGLIALPYYRESNPILAATARRAIGEVLGE